MNQSKHIKRIGSEAPVAPVYWLLQEHPELWDQHTARTSDPQSPHFGLSDIWARYAAPGVDGSQPHKSVWYPCADVLKLKELVEPILRFVRASELGGVLITRIKPGQMCKPHTDHGWHARHYEKIGVQITSAPGQAFHFEDGHLQTKPGDVFWFDNAHEHWVTNESQYERITMIVCAKTDRKVA